MERIRCSSIVALFFVAATFSTAHAVGNYQTSFESTYPSAKGSIIDTCSICHSSLSSYATNPYGSAYRGAGHNFGSIESTDSDGDGFSNIAEINALTFPGDSNSKPSTPPANKPPTANAGPDQTVTAGSSVNLNGSNSTDSDGTISKYAWSVLTGPLVTLSNPAAARATFTAPDAGTSGTSLTFRLTVTDNGGLTGTDTCVVNVTPVAPPNQPPVANAGPDQTSVENTAVILSGSNSSDPDGSIASYSWSQTAGPAAKLSNTAAANPTFTAPDAGTSGTSLTFRLTVTDNGGLTGTDTCVVNVTPVAPPNQPPVANAGPDQTAVENTTVILNGANSSDPDGTIASYAWKQTAGTPVVTLSSAAAASPNFPAPAASPTTGASGTSLAFQLTVTDNGGLTSTDTCIVNITASAPANQPPVANAGPDQNVDSGASVALAGSGSSDPDGTIATYLWKQTGGPAVTLSNPADVSPTFMAPDGGTRGTSLTFQLTVTDDGGLTATDTCIVNLAPSGDPSSNLPPEADAGQDQRVRSGVTVTLDGSNSSDPDEDFASYEWKQIRGRPVTLSSSTAVKPTFRAPAVRRSGTALVFRLTVTDQGGLKSSDTCVVNVSGHSRRTTHGEHEDD